MTVSDSRSRGERRADLSGPAIPQTILQELHAQGFDVRTAISVADGRKAMKDAPLELDLPARPGHLAQRGGTAA